MVPPALRGLATPPARRLCRPERPHGTHGHMTCFSFTMTRTRTSMGRWFQHRKMTKQIAISPRVLPDSINQMEFRSKEGLTVPANRCRLAHLVTETPRVPFRKLTLESSGWSSRREKRRQLWSSISQPPQMEIQVGKVDPCFLKYVEFPPEYVELKKNVKILENLGVSSGL